MILKDALKSIKPAATEEKKLKLVTAGVLKKLARALPNSKAIVGGSVAKGTWLKGTKEVDIFVAFDYKKYAADSERLSDHLDAGLKKMYPPRKRLHGSRDYFQVLLQGYIFEIIPILQINKPEQARNITDMSLLHAEWVKKLPQKVKDDIRLAKMFAKANGCYGAESYIGGFSGYVLEILVAYYHSFEALLKQAVAWESKTVIDLKKHYPKKDVFRELNLSKLQSPVIVIDPVDKNRNAAAALSLEKFLLFKKKAKEFLAGPDDHYFRIVPLTLGELRSRTKKNIIYLEILPLPGKMDVVGTKLLKCFEYLKEQLQPFTVKEAQWQWEGKEAVMYFFIERRQLEPFSIRVGPPLTMPEQVKSFKMVHKQTYEEYGRVYARVPYQYPLVTVYINHVLKQQFIKERIQKIKKLIIV